VVEVITRKEAAAVVEAWVIQAVVAGKKKFYASEIAEALGVDYQVVSDALEDLRKEGKLRRVFEE
jgi:predicted regulator of amino acid metabolism with ACT domain